MRDDALLAAAALGPAGLLLQALDGVKGAAGLEGADLLEVLALEPEAENGAGRGAADPGGALQLGGRPRRRGQPVERRVGQHRRLVHVRLDQLQRRLHRGARERPGRRRVGHGVGRCGAVVTVRFGGLGVLRCCRSGIGTGGCSVWGYQDLRPKTARHQGKGGGVHIYTAY